MFVQKQFQLNREISKQKIAYKGINFPEGKKFFYLQCLSQLGWTSNNHAGGFVRIALVPEGQHKSNQNFKQNVMKVACYGKDQRPGKTLYGDCIHPCNARPGCQYQAGLLVLPLRLFEKVDLLTADNFPSFFRLSS